MSRLSQPLSTLASRYDAIVVGSGYGGAVAACRLARAGLAVCVLEQGREYRAGDFPATPRALRSAVRYEGARVRLGAPDALFAFHPGEELHVITARGLGGGSLVNAAIALRPDLGTLAHRGWPASFVEDPGLGGDFARAEAMLGVTVPQDITGHPRFAALQRAAAVLAARAAPLPTAISFAPRINAANVMQYACRGCGDCWSGCNVGAKNTLALTYLPDAVHHGARIFTGCTVGSVEKAAAGGWHVAVTASEPDDPRRIAHERVISAPLVVLAAGALGSTSILLRSRARGLAVSDALGQNFSANGDDMGFIAGLAEPVHAVAIGHPPRATPDAPWPGPNCAGQIALSDAGDGESLLVQDGTMSASMARLAPLNALLRLKVGHALAMLRDGPYAGRRARTMTLYLVGHDSAAGSIRLEGDRVEVSWPGLRDEPCYARATSVMQRLAEGLDATYAPNPFSSPLLGGKKVTVHPLGGCAMGNSAKDAVVDDRGRVFDPRAAAAGAVHDGLCVSDGAIMPGSLGVNPLLTIAAMAERNLRLLADERGWRCFEGDCTKAPLRDAAM